MFKYTKYFLSKLEQLIEELAFTVRYEKGHFQSGYCIVEDKKIVVINKFYDTEARINCLLEVLDKQTIDPESLSEEGLKTYKKLESVLVAPKLEENVSID
jgi:hypothetical protein